MARREPTGADATDAVRTALKSQYHAALTMLREAIERCPVGLWSSGDYVNPFWRIVYHTLYGTHLYLQPNEAAFRPWEHHQTGIQDMDDKPAPPELQDVLELPHRPPQTGEPYTKTQMLEYWSICEGMVDGAVDALDLLDRDCGFSWHKLSSTGYDSTCSSVAEHQIMTVRHIQHHVAQLSDRLRAASGAGVDWVRARRDSEPPAGGGD